MSRHSGQGDGPRSLLRAELTRIAERFVDADRRARAAHFAACAGGDPDAAERAEAERREANGVLWAGEGELADLLLLLLRYARKHQPDALRVALAEVLRPELEPLAEAIAELEGGQ